MSHMRRLRAGAGALKSWSMRTEPVKYFTGPRADGREPFRSRSMIASPLAPAVAKADISVPPSRQARY
jgi:hypothetical protein